MFYNLMKSLIGILTCRRLDALRTMMGGIEQHCSKHDCIISEDCGQRDGTEAWLTQGRKPLALYKELMATEYVASATDARYPSARVFLGDRNLSVAGNSNRILKLFMEGDYDHLCLCNDDLIVTGDFADVYARAHSDLGVGLFCFTDFNYDETYKWTTYPMRGWKVKFMQRFIGIMMSVTKETVEKAGYFDSSFHTLGQEHCDWTIRCRMAGGIKLNGQDMNCLDIESDTLKHQDVATSVSGEERRRADAETYKVMNECSRSYAYKHYYRPFSLRMPKMAGGYRGGGIPVSRLFDCGYKLVTDLV